MKKIIGMVLALAMVLSMATVAFATGTQSDPEIVTLGGIFNEADLSQTLDAGAKYYYSYTAEATGRVTVSVYSEGAWSCVLKCGSNSVTVSSDSGIGDIDVKAGDVVSIEIANNGSDSTQIDIKVSFAKLGSMDYPEVISKMGSVSTAELPAGDWDGYTFSWTATKAGKLKVSGVSDNMWMFSVNCKNKDYYGEFHYFDAETNYEEIDVEAGDVITIVTATSDESNAITITIALSFTDTNGNVDDGSSNAGNDGSNPGTDDGTSGGAGNNTPNTGDGTSVVMAVATMVVAMSAVAVVLTNKKKFA